MNCPKPTSTHRTPTADEPFQALDVEQLEPEVAHPLHREEAGAEDILHHGRRHESPLPRNQKMRLHLAMSKLRKVQLTFLQVVLPPILMHLLVLVTVSQGRRVKDRDNQVRTQNTLLRLLVLLHMELHQDRDMLPEGQRVDEEVQIRA
jgi:hypothetical protein